MPDNINYKIEKIGSIGASILGGEGIFMMKINGPANFKVCTKSVDALRNYVYGVATTAVERESKSSGGNNSGFGVKIGDDGFKLSF
jgi:hypothetical protein